MNGPLCRLRLEFMTVALVPLMAGSVAQIHPTFTTPFTTSVVIINVMDSMSKLCAMPTCASSTLLLWYLVAQEMHGHSTIVFTFGIGLIICLTNSIWLETTLTLCLKKCWCLSKEPRSTSGSTVPTTFICRNCGSDSKWHSDN